MNLSKTITDDFTSCLLDWYGKNARSLPWRNTQNPYRIWISEIMLQQTQVSTVIPYYEKFIQNYPTLSRVAHAPLEEVLGLWSGLGYYRRARQLKRSAEIMVEKYDSQIPSDYHELLTLPGIGQYTAGAILSIAFNLSFPVLDGNVIRVLTRVFAINESLTQKETKDKLWQLSSKLIPENKAREFNQALMELGALVCLPKENAGYCKSCPIHNSCMAYKMNLVSELPNLPKRRKKVKINQIAIMMINKKKVLLIQRSDKKILNEMWEVPSEKLSQNESHNKAVLRILNNDYLIKGKKLEYLKSLSHSITYRSITSYVYQMTLSHNQIQQIELQYQSLGVSYRWIFPNEITKIPHSSLLTKMVSLITL